MKLRIKGDSIRLRLTRGEVQALKEQGAVEDRVRFAPDTALIYRVRRDGQIAALTASYTQGLLEVRIPEQAAREWCGSDLVTLEYTRSAVDGVLRLVVEKDFACLAGRPGEEESENYPHPVGSREPPRR